MYKNIYIHTYKTNCLKTLSVQAGFKNFKNLGISVQALHVKAIYDVNLTVTHYNLAKKVSVLTLMKIVNIMPMMCGRFSKLIH